MGYPLPPPPAPNHPGQESTTQDPQPLKWHRPRADHDRRQHQNGGNVNTPANLTTFHRATPAHSRLCFILQLARIPLKLSFPTLSGRPSLSTHSAPLPFQRSWAGPLPTGFSSPEPTGTAIRVVDGPHTYARGGVASGSFLARTASAQPHPQKQLIAWSTWGKSILHTRWTPLGSSSTQR